MFCRRCGNELAQNHFNSKSWYKGTIETKDFTDNMLSDIERSNKDVIVKVEGIKAAENTANQKTIECG